jgi:hypothetical protein
MKMNLWMKLRLRMTMSTWELVKGCPVRRRGQGSLMLPDISSRHSILPDVEVWNVGWKCHRRNLKMDLEQSNAIKCNWVLNGLFEIKYQMWKSGMPTGYVTRRLNLYSAQSNVIKSNIEVNGFY